MSILEKVKMVAKVGPYSPKKLLQFLESAAETEQQARLVAEAMNELRESFGALHKKSILQAIQEETRAGDSASFKIKNSGGVSGTFATGTLRKSPQMVNEEGEPVVVVFGPVTIHEPTEEAEFEIIEETENADTKMETKLLPERLGLD